MKWDFKWWS